jgi:hypothetical protein
MPLANSSSESYSPDNFIMGGPVQTNSGTLTSGENLAQYSVLGRVTATGKLVECDNAAVDGSEVPVGILIYAVDASAADKDCQMYVAGKFNTDLINWPASFNTQPEKDGAFDGTAISLKTAGE